MNLFLSVKDSILYIENIEFDINSQILSSDSQIEGDTMNHTKITAVADGAGTWNEERQAWNQRSEFFVELHERADRKAQVTHFLKYLKEHDLLPQLPAKTLDIGCGVGDYSLGLAFEGYEATGIDLSDGMIEGARKLSEMEHVDLDLYVGPWSEVTRMGLGWDRDFDLTYSFFCPVMFDPDNVRAMSRTSKGKCLLVAFAGRQDTIVDHLTKQLYGEEGFDWQANIDGVLAVVDELSNTHHVDYITTPEVEYFAEEEALRYFGMRLHSDAKGTMEDTKVAIKPLLEPFKEADGRIKNTTEDKVAWISWTPEM